MADLLTRGFPARPRKYWTTALGRLEARVAPDGCPRFGYLLEADGRVVGALLLIFSERDGQVRCNLSSWYVVPEHRGHAAVMAALATKLKHVTYLNTSPAPHTWPILQAQGYVRYSAGQFLALPALGSGRGRARRLTRGERDRMLPEYELLRAHAEAGCEVLVCDTAAGAQPFVFLRRRIARGAARRHATGLCAQHRQLRRQRPSARPLPGDARRAAGDLRRRRRRSPACRACCFKERGPRFFKGPERPRQNDLAFTEMVVFGPIRAAS